MGNILASQKPLESFALDELSLCDPLPSLVDIECPICLQIMLYDPCLVSCCGHHFCSNCITEAKKNKPACPYCKADNYDTMADKGLERIIKTIKVKCTCHLKGCQWRGELIDLVDHLRRDDRQGDCPYAVVECDYKCDYKGERNQLSDHELSSCPKRPYKCHYCNYNSTYTEVTNEHFKTCKRYPIKCPNNCDTIIKLERRYMDEHVTNECPLTIVSCDYKQDGCGWTGQRQGLEFHYTQYCSTHLTFVHKRTRHLETENDNMKKEIKELNKLIKNAASKLRDQSNDINKLQSQLTELRLRNHMY